MVKRVAVLGAGACGLAAIKCCLDEGLFPVCFERSNEIGGLWHYKENSNGQQARIMKSTIMNFSKEMMAFSDFPVPGHYPNYMHNTKVFEYFKNYARHNNLEKYIKFGTNVLRIKKHEDFRETGKWKVQVQYPNNQNTEIEVFDAICLCTGLHSKKSMPTFKGEEKFKGQKVHTQTYTDYHGYEDKTVLLIGIGNSSGDIAVELSRVAKQVYVTSRNGNWVMNRIGKNGLPRDLELSRFSAALRKSSIGKCYINTNTKKCMNIYGSKPKHRYEDKIPLINDDLPDRLINGSIIMKPDIVCFDENSVKFVDGSVVNDLDKVIYATGYTIGFPMLEEQIIDVKENKLSLYKYVFPVDLEKPTLAVIGCIEPWGSINPVAELQCRWAARVFKGVNTLPNRVEILDDMSKKQKEIAERKMSNPRYYMQVDWITYMDEIAELIGCKPKLGHLVTFDPVLASKVYFGPCTPYQYRLYGPGKWNGARMAIMTAMERVKEPLQSACTDDVTKIYDVNVILIMFILIFGAILKFFI